MLPLIGLLAAGFVGLRLAKRSPRTAVSPQGSAPVSTAGAVPPAPQQGTEFGALAAGVVNQTFTQVTATIAEWEEAKAANAEAIEQVKAIFPHLDAVVESMRDGIKGQIMAGATESEIFAQVDETFDEAGIVLPSVDGSKALARTYRYDLRPPSTYTTPSQYYKYFNDTLAPVKGLNGRALEWFGLFIRATIKEREAKIDDPVSVPVVDMEPRSDEEVGGDYVAAPTIYKWGLTRDQYEYLISLYGYSMVEVWHNSGKLPALIEKFRAGGIAVFQ